jgi:hypothetical protein
LFIVDDLIAADKTMSNYFTDYANKASAQKAEKYASLAGSPLLSGIDNSVRQTLYITARIQGSDDNTPKSEYYAKAVKAAAGFLK